MEPTCHKEPPYQTCFETDIVSTSRPFPQRCLDDRSLRNGSFYSAYPSAPDIARATAASTHRLYSIVCPFYPSRTSPGSSASAPDEELGHLGVGMGWMKLIVPIFADETGSTGIETTKTISSARGFDR
jgi:hypothetical protein